MNETGGQSSTRGYRMSSFSPADIAALCSGLPDHKYWAGLVSINGSDSHARMLTAHLETKIVNIAARTWNIPGATEEERDRNRNVKIHAVSFFAVERLKNPDKVIKTGVYTMILECKRQTYHTTWKRKIDDQESRLHSWVSDLDRHMWRQYSDREQKNTG